MPLSDCGRQRCADLRDYFGRVCVGRRIEGTLDLIDDIRMRSCHLALRVKIFVRLLELSDRLAHLLLHCLQAFRATEKLVVCRPELALELGDALSLAETGRCR